MEGLVTADAQQTLDWTLRVQRGVLRLQLRLLRLLLGRRRWCRRGWRRRLVVGLKVILLVHRHLDAMLRQTGNGKKNLGSSKNDSREVQMESILVMEPS